MDRRQKKTRDSIFKAFSRLLEKKRYEQITVQDIIDEANVGRSTFYAHFETKDMLLKTMCSDIFDHIFDSSLYCGTGNDYEEHGIGIEAKLAHILWHLQEVKMEVTGILSSESGSLFIRYLTEYLKILFNMYLDTFKKDVPEDYLLNYLIGSFTATVKWWVDKKMATSPEETAGYFMKMVQITA